MEDKTKKIVKTTLAVGAAVYVGNRILKSKKQKQDLNSWWKN